MFPAAHGVVSQGGKATPPPSEAYATDWTEYTNGAPPSDWTARWNAATYICVVPPQPLEPAQHHTDFSEHAIGAPPSDWTARWAAATYTVKGE